jgi:hypothetical protein
MRSGFVRHVNMTLSGLTGIKKPTGFKDGLAGALHGRSIPLTVTVISGRVG